MAYRPPKGVRPPQLEGKRTGRPKGSRSYTSAWNNVIWGYMHRNLDRAAAPNSQAGIWWFFARHFPGELKEFLKEYRRL